MASFVAMTVLACTGSRAPADAPLLPPTRGYILLSVDTLRADHLGLYGYERDTSPFLDSLAGRAAVFENAFAQLPGTLPSHMTMLTGLYPDEHQVLPPAGVLDPSIPLVSEAFARAGFRTAGHSEGGYVHGRFGFARGFQEWNDDAKKIETDVERTLERGRRFLRGLASDQRFFLFLHTYVVHDPYFPTDEYLARFWPGTRPDVPPATGPNLAAMNLDSAPLSPTGLDFYRSSYDASIRYLDDVLRSFFADLEAMGVLADTTVFITSDHGEEFREHGSLVHEQIYPETLHVPLLVLHPRIQAGFRVPQVVELASIAPTLCKLARVEPLHPMTGTSVADLVSNPGSERATGGAYARNTAGDWTTLIWKPEGETRQQILLLEPASDGGAWLVGPEATLDIAPEVDRVSLRSFHGPRRLVASLGGQSLGELNVVPDAISDLPLPSRSVPSRLRLSFDGCAVPAAVQESSDRRCLSARVQGLPYLRIELYDLEQDPGATADVALSREEGQSRMLRMLRAHRKLQTPRGEARQETLDGELEERLRALGYLR